MNAVTGVAGQLRLDEGDADGSSNEVRERATGLNSAPAAPGTGPAARARVTGDVIEIFHDAQVRVFSDAGLTRAQGEALAHRVEAAYTFDKKLQHWDRPAALAKPITVAALSDEKFAQVTGDRSGRVAGITTGPDVFAMPARVATRRNADDDDTIAHELGHVQDLREGGSNISQVPIYLQEGKEYLLGDRYPASHGQATRSRASVANELARISGSDALWVLNRFRTVADEAHAGSRGFLGETVGALYVEFLRTRLKGGKPDAIARVADVISGVGRGVTARGRAGLRAVRRADDGRPQRTSARHLLRRLTSAAGARGGRAVVARGSPCPLSTPSRR